MSLPYGGASIFVDSKGLYEVLTAVNSEPLQQMGMKVTSINEQVTVREMQIWLGTISLPQREAQLKPVINMRCYDSL